MVPVHSTPQSTRGRRACWWVPAFAGMTAESAARVSSRVEPFDDNTERRGLHIVARLCDNTAASTLRRMNGSKGMAAVRAIRNFTLIAVAAGLLGACETLSGIEGLGGGGQNYAAGQPLGERLNGGDREALSAAFVAAMDGDGQQNWRGRRANGAVIGAGYALAGLRADPDTRLDAARGDLDLAVRVETELGGHVLTRNSNIRIAPDPKAKIAEVLPAGSGVDVVGGVKGRNWRLVAVDNVVRGYVYGDLLVKAPGTELELAGGPVRKPVLCRKFRQRIVAGGERAEWEGAACNDGTGWRLAREPGADESAPEMLLDY